MRDNLAMAQPMDRTGLEGALAALGDVLAYRGEAYEIVLVGGADLVLRGIVSRPTKDADIVGQRLGNGRIVPLRRLPDALARAVFEVADAHDLAPDWLNVGPESLLELGLPAGFEDRLTARHYGGLTVWLAGLYDLVCFKLYAAADHWPSQDRHLDDLRALCPTEADLVSSARWSMTHDPSPAFRGQLTAVLAHLGVEEADARLD
jgi:hypothetical protein